MLVDEIDIILSGGHGGAGKVSFGKMMGSGPNGGNGGRGGSLFVEAISDIYALNQFSKSNHREAENGVPGGLTQKEGKAGEDLTVKLPIGTHLTDQETGETIELKKVGDRVLVCRGGIGGLGNYELRSARNTTPMTAQGGRPGDERHFKAELKLIADYGLIGLPNAGKSSLLNELTRADAKVGDYQFTTLEPNLGVLKGKIIADIPGLIEGASEGRGLGIKFLKHIEKVAVLLHCVEADSENVVQDYKTVRTELENYDLGLTKKREIVLLTKTDLVDPEKLKEVKGKLGEIKGVKQVFPISIYDFEAIEKLKKLL